MSAGLTKIGAKNCASLYSTASEISKSKSWQGAWLEVPCIIGELTLTPTLTAAASANITQHILKFNLSKS